MKAHMGGNQVIGLSNCTIARGSGRVRAEAGVECAVDPESGSGTPSGGAAETGERDDGVRSTDDMDVI
jgi:hypothetical protein